MTFALAVTARVSPSAFPNLLELSIDAGRSLLRPVQESLEGTFIERPLRVTAGDVPGAIRALGLPPDTEVASSRLDGTQIELLLRGRLDHRASVDIALCAMSACREDVSFSVRRDPSRGEIHVTGEVASLSALNGWLEPLLLVAMAAETLGGDGRAAFFADGDDYYETLVADVYRVESGRLVFERLDPPNAGFEAVRDTFRAHGLVIEA